MDSIDKLKKSVSNMSDNELFDLVRDIRTSRRTSKSRGTKKTKELDLSSLINSLSSEDADRLLKRIKKK